MMVSDRCSEINANRGANARICDTLNLRALKPSQISPPSVTGPLLAFINKKSFFLFFFYILGNENLITPRKEAS